MIPLSYHIVSNNIESYIRSSHRMLSSSTVSQRSRSHQLNVKKLLKTKTKDGLFLSREQVERIWGSYGCNGDFSVQSFVTQYPRVSPELTKIVNNDVQSNATHIASPPLSSPLAEEAEAKLYRMIQKIHSHSNEIHDAYDLEISLQILSLLSQELDVVIDLWIRISNSSTCQTLQNAIDATDRASYLISQVQVPKDIPSVNNQMPPIAIKTFQNTINQYHRLYHINASTLSVPQTLHLHVKSVDILKSMARQILRMKMFQEYNSQNTDDGPLFLSIIAKDASPLNESYEQVIDILTKVTTHTKLTKEDQIHSINTASNLLKDMELYTHEMIVNDDDAISRSESISKIFKSIYPTQICFQMVIEAYCHISIHHNDRVYLSRAHDILERMHRRYDAYTRNMMDTKLRMSPEQRLNYLHYVSLPSKETYECVLKGYCHLRGSLNSNDKERILSIEQKLQPMDDVYHQLMIYWKKLLNHANE